MRRILTTQQAIDAGLTPASLDWARRTGRLQGLHRGVLVEGNEPSTVFEKALGLLVVTDGIATGTLAARLHGLDGVVARKPFVAVTKDNRTERAGITRASVGEEVTIEGFRCASGLDTMLSLATVLCDLRWEQALESALRKDLVTVDSLVAALQTRRRGNKLIRRVLGLRLTGAPPTESMLETLAVQLIRTEPRLPEPRRQVVVCDEWGHFVARVDLAWPEHGVFMELDGQQHRDQPVYDARRETAVVAATGWLPARFTWTEITRHGRATNGRLLRIHRQAARLGLHRLEAS